MKTCKKSSFLHSQPGAPGFPAQECGSPGMHIDGKLCRGSFNSKTPASVLASVRPVFVKRVNHRIDILIDLHRSLILIILGTNCGLNIFNQYFYGNGVKNGL